MNSKYYEPWTESAACSQVGGDLWFPEIGESLLGGMSPLDRSRYEPQWLAEQEAVVAA